MTSSVLSVDIQVHLAKDGKLESFVRECRHELRQADGSSASAAVAISICTRVDASGSLRSFVVGVL